MRALVPIALVAGIPPVNALCIGPAACRLIGVVLGTFILSLGQLAFMFFSACVLGISCCNR
jgi:hypothetical protein